MQPTRRKVLRGIAAGTISLSLVGPVSADGTARYVVEGRGNGLRRRLEREGFAVEHEIADGNVLVVEGPADADPASVAGVTNAVQDYQFRFEGPEIVEPEPSPDTTDDAFYDIQWDKQVTDVAEAHSTATGDGSTVAIIDTGTDVDDHPDLPNVDASAGRLFRNGTIRSGTGTVEFPADRGDMCAGTTTITDHVADDAHYHGTHVAGIAAASREGTTGIVGTAPDARVVPLRVFWWDELPSDCDGDDEVEESTAVLTTTTVDILLAIDYAAAIGADAANMSIGTPPIPPQGNAGGVKSVYQTVIQSAVRRGTVVVVSAGNASADLQHGGTFTLPNSVAGAMSISATGPNDELVFYSNFGTDEVDVGAPGGGYETLVKTLCRPDGTIAGCDPEETEDDCQCDPPEWPYPTNLVWSTVDPDGLLQGSFYTYLAGTSMAAPQVTGTAALVREVAPDANANQVEQAIEQGAELVRGKGDPELGAGRLSASGALDSV